MKKIFISTSSFGELDKTPIEMLRKAGFEVSFNPHGRSLSEEEVVHLVSDADGLIAGTEPLGSRTLSKLRSLKVISRCGAGLDNVDLGSADRLKIKVFNTPDAPTMAVAELTVALTLALLRRITIMDRDIRQGRWKKCMGALLSGKKTGIIGFGRIGRKVGELFNALGARVSYADPNVPEPEGGVFKKVGLKNQIGRAHV